MKKLFTMAAVLFAVVAQAQTYPPPNAVQCWSNELAIDVCDPSREVAPGHYWYTIDPGTACAWGVVDSAYGVWTDSVFETVSSCVTMTTDGTHPVTLQLPDTNDLHCQCNRVCTINKLGQVTCGNPTVDTCVAHSCGDFGCLVTAAPEPATYCRNRCIAVWGMPNNGVTWMFTHSNGCQ